MNYPFSSQNRHPRLILHLPELLFHQLRMHDAIGADLSARGNLCAVADEGDAGAQEVGIFFIRLRGVALAVMALLESFRPCLIGAVLDGTAGRYADVELELFADSAKDVEIFLLSRHIPYEHLKPGRTRPDAPEAKLRMECQDEYVILLIQPHQAERRNSGQGRARAPEVAALLAD